MAQKETAGQDGKGAAARRHAGIHDGHEACRRWVEGLRVVQRNVLLPALLGAIAYRGPAAALDILDYIVTCSGRDGYPGIATLPITPSQRLTLRPSLRTFPQDTTETARKAGFKTTAHRLVFLTSRPKSQGLELRQ